MATAHSLAVTRVESLPSGLGVKYTIAVNMRIKILSLAVASIVVTLLFASITMRSSGVTDETIHATGTISTQTDLVALGQSKFGNVTITTRHQISHYFGGVSGFSNGVQTYTQDLNANISQSRCFCLFNITVGGKSGQFMGMIMGVLDKKNPSGNLTAYGTVVFMEGSGIDGFKGLCGGGTFRSTGNFVQGFVSYYDYTFKFGKDCQK